MGSYREQSNLAKAKQRGIVDAKVVAPKSKKAKPVRVEYQYHHSTGWLLENTPGWFTYGRYATREQAEEAARGRLRKYPTLYAKARIDGVEFQP